RFLLYIQRGAQTRMDIWILPRADGSTARPLLQTAFDENFPQFSPDGRWLAYVSDQTGAREVYVQSFTSDGQLGPDRRVVSTKGGAVPHWRHDGSELFYVAADGQLMSVPVATRGESIQTGPPRGLFHTRMLNLNWVYHEYDVTPDGQRFLVGTTIGE